jgi:hypothetical protein
MEILATSVASIPPPLTPPHKGEGELPRQFQAKIVEG